MALPNPDKKVLGINICPTCESYVCQCSKERQQEIANNICITCHGKGVIGGGTYMTTVACSNCHGSGVEKERHIKKTEELLRSMEENKKKEECILCKGIGTVVNINGESVQCTVCGKKEVINHPSHYGGDTTYEVVKVIEAWGLDSDAYLFNTIKYIARARHKGNELEDLKKAQFYLNRRIGIMMNKEKENGN